MMTPRILVIDDDEPIRDLLRRALEGAGYLVDEAADGREGTQVFRERPADLIIVDIFMPRQEGIETITTIQQVSPHVKTIAMSGGGLTGEMEFLEHAKTFGAVRTFTKPPNLETLIDCVRELVGPPGSE